MQEKNGNTTSPELTLEQARASIASYLEQGNAGQYNIGRIYNYLVKRNLATKNGYESTEAFFNQHFKALSQSMLTRYGTVARKFTEEACGKYGVTNLLALRNYAATANIQIASGDPGPTLIDVPQEGGGIERKPFSKCSVEELKLASKQKRAPSRATVPADEETHVERMRKSIDHHFGEDSQVKIKASVQDGETLLTIQGVPFKQVDRLMEALKDGFMPQPMRAAG